MVAVLCDSCHGCAGSIWYLTVQVHSPAILASIACGAPGVAAFIILSIIAFCSADICGGASAASATAATNRATMASASGVFIGTSMVGARTNAAQASKVPAVGRWRAGSLAVGCRPTDPSAWMQRAPRLRTCHESLRTEADRNRRPRRRAQQLLRPPCERAGGPAPPATAVQGQDRPHGRAIHTGLPQPGRGAQGRAE